MSTWLLCALLAASAPTSQAVAADRDLQQALACYQALDYSAVAPLLERALAKPDLSPADRRLALAYLGRTHAIFRRAEPATAAFTQLLALDPDYAVGAHESPLIRDAFARARARVDGSGAAVSTEPRRAAPPRPTEAQAGAPAQAGGAEPTGQRASAALASPPEHADQEELPLTTLLLAGAGAAALLAAGAVAVVLIVPREPAPPPGGSLGRWDLP